MPLLLALTGVIATIGLLAIPSHLVPMDQNVSAVVLLIGLAVGVDYSLFYIKREREERAAGRGHRAALEAAAATSGRSVLISGVTVMVAMAGMLLAGDKMYMSFGIATIVVVGIAMLGSLTVLPAVLSKLGDRVEKGRIPFMRRLRRPSGENRFWSAVLTPALRHPAISARAAAAVLIVMALPVLHIHTGQMGLGSIPKSWSTVETIDRLQQAFPGNASPAVVAINANTDDAATKNAIDSLRAQALASGKMQGPIEVDVNPAHTVARVTIPLQGEGTDARSNAALRQLRQVDPAGDRRHRPRRDLRGHRRHRRLGGRELAAQAQVADRVRVRAHARVPAPARLVPLGRRRGQGGRPQPALRRRRVRRARRRLPVGLGRERCSTSAATAASRTGCRSSCS